MDPVYDKALKEKVELERRLAELNRFLELYRELAGGAGVFYGPSQSTEAVAEAGPGASIERVRPTRLRRVKPSEMVDMAADAMKSLRKPLTRGELVNEIERRGALIPGESKETKGRYIGTVMWRAKDRFHNVEGRGYWLKDRPVPKIEPEDPMQQELQIMRDMTARREIEPRD